MFGKGIKELSVDAKIDRKTVARIVNAAKLHINGHYRICALLALLQCIDHTIYIDWCDVAYVLGIYYDKLHLLPLFARKYTRRALNAIRDSRYEAALARHDHIMYQAHSDIVFANLCEIVYFLNSTIRIVGNKA